MNQGRNSHVAPPVFDATQIPSCVDLQPEACQNAAGCQLVASKGSLPEACVPTPRAFFNTISHRNDANDAKVLDALAKLAGRSPGPVLTRLMQSDRHWLLGDMANKFRPPGVSSHPWIPTAQSTWERQKVVEYVQQDLDGVKCGICFDAPDGLPCEQMKCCGSVFHVVCADGWFSEPSRVLCPGCNTVVRAQNNGTRYNMTHHIPSDTIRSSDRDGCMRLTSPAVGDGGLCAIDFEFAVDVAKIARHRSRYGHDAEPNFDTYLSELVDYVASLGLIEGHVTINPSNAAERDRGNELVRLALDLGSEAEIKYHLTPANDHQLPAIFEEGSIEDGDRYLAGVLKLYCGVEGHSISLQQLLQILPPVNIMTLSALGVYCPVVATVQQLADFCRSNRRHMAVAYRLADASSIAGVFALLKSDHDWRDLSQQERESFADAKPGVRSPGIPCSVVRRSQLSQPYVLCFVNFEHRFADGV